MFTQGKIERHKLVLAVLLLAVWTAFGLFFGTQNYIRDSYAGQAASLPGYIISWIFCGYSWAILTLPAVYLIRRFSLKRLGPLKFAAIHLPAAVVFASAQLAIYLFIAGVLFRTTNKGLIDFYTFLLANELQSSVLVYLAIVTIVTVKDRYFNGRPVLPVSVSKNGVPVDVQTTIPKSGHHTIGFVRRLSVKHNGSIVLIDTNQINWIQSYGNYLFIHTPQGKLLHRETMSAMEKKLDPSEFVRIRRSAIVKIDQVRELRPVDNGEFEIVLMSGDTLTSTRRFKKNLESILRA